MTAGREASSAVDVVEDALRTHMPLRLSPRTLAYAALEALHDAGYGVQYELTPSARKPTGD